MNYDDARAEIIGAKDISDPKERERIINRVSAEALVDIAAGLHVLVDLQAERMGYTGLLEDAAAPDAPAEPSRTYIIGDRVELLGQPQHLYLVDQVRSDQGETALRLEADDDEPIVTGWVYASTVKFVDRPVDDFVPGLAADDPVSPVDADESLDDAFAKLKKKAKK